MSPEAEATGVDDGQATGNGPINLDWSGGDRRLVGPRTAIALAGVVVVALVFAYDYTVLGDQPVAFGYDVGRLDWLWLACLWVDGVYVLGAILGDRERAVAFYRKLRARPLAFVAAGFVLTLLLVGTVGPLVMDQPTSRFEYSDQPPMFTSVPADNVVTCENPSGERCQGSLRFPLGTDAGGKDVLKKVVLASRVEVQLLLVTMTLIVPLATAAGTISAYVGGRTDRAITTVAETVKTVPALLVFLVWRFLAADGSLFALVVAFGLVNWGNVAVVVRSRALNEVGKDYVMAAEAAGASALEVVTDHLMPNVSRTALSVAVYQLPLFVTIEATLSFLKFGSPPSFLLTTLPTQESWGRMIGRNIESVQPYWWRVVVPVVALMVTILALNVLADGLQDVLDPHGGD